MDALFLTDDLLFAQRVQSAAQRRGLAVKVLSPTQVDQAPEDPQCRLAIIDLAGAGPQATAAIATLKARLPAAQLVGYGPHVDEPLLAAARAAGCQLVLPRSQFNQRYDALLAECCGG